MINHPSYRVLGVGHACMDLLIHVEESFLTQISGEKGGSQGIKIDQLNDVLAKLSNQPYLATGGSSANAIKGLACLGEKCTFISHVGNDALGETFIQYMNKLGIRGFYTKSLQYPTTQILCLITPDGQRTMRFCGGASGEMNAEILHPEYFNGIKLVHIDAYSMRNAGLVEKVMQMAKEAGAQVSIDLSSFEIVRQFHAPMTQLLNQYVDIVFANEDEVRALTGLEAYEGCLKLQQMCPIAVVLMGKEGCLVGHREVIFHSPGIPAKLVDSTGAGDLFASGFLYGYLQDYSLEKCAKFGNRLGSAIVEVEGAELPPEKWASIRAALQAEQ